MIQTIEIGTNLLNTLLFLCLILWTIARVLEVWLNVYERVDKRRGKEE